MSIFQYIKDTHGELRHVAWPTEMQTIIYTSLVVGISLFFSVYLGLFDYLFTSGLEMTLDILPAPAQNFDLVPQTESTLPTAEVTIPLNIDAVSGEAPVFEVAPKVE